MYYYAATVFFEAHLWRITLQCKTWNHRTGHSTQGAYVDDPNFSDISVPHPSPSAYFNGAPPEFISRPEEIAVSGIIVTPIANSVVFRAPVDHNPYKDMIWEVVHKLNKKVYFL